MLEELAEAEDEDNSSYKTMTAMGILNTIQNLLSAVSQNKKIMPKIENILAGLLRYSYLFEYLFGIIAFLTENLAWCYQDKHLVLGPVCIFNKISNHLQNLTVD